MSASKLKRLLKARKQIAHRPCLKSLSTSQTQPLRIRADANSLMSPYPTIPRNAPNLRNTEPHKMLTPIQAMQEFFGHPLTWERNNGFLNALIGMLVLTFWFTSNTQMEKDKEKQEVSQKHSFEEMDEADIEA